ncbi:hypothetical protein FH608_049320 [Nonomuraea phyllanthi]|uniref:Restriction endonuclease subunit S n=1 Tax=Nonomuraea phyllanthi TaxID=2219224 RepID=A0A8E0W2A0_9ACTN|nr:hypothetical protein FH608_049320 [Nonomuraea phyllanthi]
MALMKLHVAAPDIARSGAARLDPRFHYLRRSASPLIDHLKSTVRLGLVATFSNGLNLPRSAYAEDAEDGAALYASVAALSSAVLRPSSCIPLKTTGNYVSGIRIAIEEIAVRPDELLITRSGTPGVAWSGAQVAEDTAVIPSGFIIRGIVDQEFSVDFVAAILNHPAWRLLTSALASGKRQDNLSQEQLADVPIPIVDHEIQRGIAFRFQEALGQIENLYGNESDFTSICDEVLSVTLGLCPPLLPRLPVQVRRVPVGEVAETRTLRIDNRWHGAANLVVRSALREIERTTMRALLEGGPSKGRQPRWISEEQADKDTPRGISTATIQSGTISWENAKPTTQESVEAFPVRRGELLVAMDGDGSLGKAAVYERDSAATVDSHIARCRLIGGPEVADAVSCYLNSTWGRVQTTSLMTGATGQTQLNPADLCNIIIPSELIVRASGVSSAYRTALGEYESLVRKARRIISEASADLTQQLIRVGAVEQNDRLASFEDPTYLLGVFDLLYLQGWR